MVSRIMHRGPILLPTPSNICCVLVASKGRPRRITGRPSYRKYKKVELLAAELRCTRNSLSLWLSGAASVTHDLPYPLVQFENARHLLEVMILHIFRNSAVHVIIKPHQNASMCPLRPYQYYLVRVVNL